jgi:hypothetical protein
MNRGSDRTIRLAHRLLADAHQQPSQRKRDDSFHDGSPPSLGRVRKNPFLDGTPDAARDRKQPAPRAWMRRYSPTRPQGRGSPDKGLMRYHE